MANIALKILEALTQLVGATDEVEDVADPITEAMNESPEGLSQPVQDFQVFYKAYMRR